MTLTEQFEAAKVQSKTLTNKPSNETLLELYAYYKQGSHGDCDTEAPSNPFDFVARAKHTAWEELKGTTKDKAMNHYILLVQQLKDNG
jgi:diazepam-binding inhibitor (GABA receptor modulator, acyl-CoA-binding protein)